MPTLSNITVKKYDGTTDVIYIPVSSASSDGVKAEYQNQTGFTVPATRPLFSISTRGNSAGTSRRVSANFIWPLFYTDPVTGKLTRSGGIPGSFTMVVPQDVDPLITREAHQQFAHLCAAAAMKDVMDTGYAPR